MLIRERDHELPDIETQESLIYRSFGVPLVEVENLPRSRRIEMYRKATELDKADKQLLAMTILKMLLPDKGNEIDSDG